MYSESFDYYRPSTLDEAISLLNDVPGAKLLAGGHSLLPSMKLRVSSTSALIDIGRLPGLSGVEIEGNTLKIGALTTHATIAESEEVRAACPILAETAAQIGDQQVRNRGTIGGSLAYADPSADLPTSVMALRGTLTANGPDGERQIAAEDFFTDLFTTALRSNEVLTTLTVPVMGPGDGGAYQKHPHPASRYAVVGVSAWVNLSNGTVNDVSLVVGGVTANPTRCSAAETALKGQAATEEHIRSAADLVAESISDPMGDLYASGEYRTHLAKVIARRALIQAVERAGG